jgi:hypothetical protein
MLEPFGKWAEVCNLTNLATRIWVLVGLWVVPGFSIKWFLLWFNGGVCLLELARFSRVLAIFRNALVTETHTE